MHTQLPCCISFRKANVHPHGTNFVTVYGRCSVCSSCFKGIISEKPLDDERYLAIFINIEIFYRFFVNIYLHNYKFVFYCYRVLMHCTYTGNFDILHDSNKKRRLLGIAKEKVITAIVNKNMSSATHREKEAVRLMKTGDFVKLYFKTRAAAYFLRSSIDNVLKWNPERNRRRHIFGGK